MSLPPSPPSIILHVIVHTGNDPLSEKCFNSLLKKSFELKNEVSFLIAELLEEQQVIMMIMRVPTEIFWTKGKLCLWKSTYTFTVSIQYTYYVGNSIIEGLGASEWLKAELICNTQLSSSWVVNAELSSKRLLKQTKGNFRCPPAATNDDSPTPSKHFRASGSPNAVFCSALSELATE